MAEIRFISMNALADYICENIKEYLPGKYRNMQVTKLTVSKEDRSGISIVILQPETAVNAVLDMEEVYTCYKDGMDIEEVMHECADFFQDRLDSNAEEQHFDTGEILDYKGYVKDHLIRHIVTRPEREDFPLDTFVHRRVGDFVEVYFVDIKAHLACITEPLLSLWGVTEDELHQDALKAEDRNRPAALYSSTDAAASREKGENPVNLLTAGEKEVAAILAVENAETFGTGESASMFFLTSEKEWSGAAAMLRDDVLQKVRGIIGQEFLLSPVDADKVVIVPDTPISRVTLASLISMESMSEFFSGTVYRYYPEGHALVNLKDCSVVDGLSCRDM